MNDPLPPVRPPNSAAGSVPSKNGEARLPEGPLDTAHLAQLLTPREEPVAEETNASPASPANGEPEEPRPPTNEEEPGQENLPSEESAEGPETAEAEDADATVLSQEEQELTDALNGLNADAKKHLIEVAQAIQKGETSIGQVKRQLKLGRQENEELQRLREENEQLRNKPATVVTDGKISPEITKLKSVQEVEQAVEEKEKAIRAIEDFLEDNPQGGQIGDKEFSRADLIQRKRQFQDDLKALPKHAARLQQQQALTAARTEMQAALKKDFPFYADGEHPDTKAAKALLQRQDLAPYFSALPNADYVALCLAKGHSVLQGDLTKRKAGVKPATAPVKTGTAPARTPHAAPAAAAKGQSVSAKSLLGKVSDTRSFADFVDAAGV